MKFVLCAFSDASSEKGSTEEKVSLIEEAKAVVADVKPTKALSKEVYATVSSGLDIFKGLLAFLMVYSHVDLCLVNPTEVYYGKLGHFVGNAASGMCFLGFVFSYGYTCYWAYLSELRPRPMAEKLTRVARSAILPIIGAWVCSFAWSYMCFKIPINTETAVGILTFYYVWGNGPDFLMSFTTMLLVSFLFRDVINKLVEYKPTTQGRIRFAFGALFMIFAPLLITKMVVADCTGNGRYFQFFLPCDKREASGMANLPALPHFFYFNIGVVAAVAVKLFGECLDSTASQLPGLNTLAKFDFRGIGVAALALQVVLAVLAYPLYAVWWTSYGNISTMTPYGEIIRGWSRGPTPLWLLGNLWAIYTLVLFCLAFAYVARKFTCFQYLTRELEHTGANVLIYLVVSDCLLAGLYRGTEFPLTAAGGCVATVSIMLATRFVHYLGHSGRK